MQSLQIRYPILRCAVVTFSMPDQCAVFEVKAFESGGVVACDDESLFLSQQRRRNWLYE